MSAEFSVPGDSESRPQDLKRSFALQANHGVDNLKFLTRCQRCDSPDITARVPAEEFKRAEWEDCECYACGDVHEKETPIGERAIRASMFCWFCGWKWVTRWIPPLQAGNLIEAEAARLKEEAEAGR